MTHENCFDVAIIGSGIGGTLLATILARNGVRVLALEGSSHPRFTMGESTVPETTVRMRTPAYRYGVPELRHLSNYFDARRNIGPTSGVKRSFSFLYHRAGQPVPKSVRRYYFRHAGAVLKTVRKNLPRSWEREWRNSFFGPWGYFRDAMISNNRDWKRQVFQARRMTIHS